jgi:hypothetical protein
MLNETVYYERISTCEIGHTFGGYQITDSSDLAKVKKFFENGGAKVKCEGGRLIISAGLYLAATSAAYSILEMDVGGDEVWIKDIFGRKCTTGLFAFKGIDGREVVLFVTKDLERFLSSTPDQGLLTDDTTCSLRPSLRA